MFSQAHVNNSVHRGGLHGRGLCMTGEGACMVGGMHDRGGHTWQGGVHGGGGGACVAGETATAADGTHPTGMHSCFLLMKLQRFSYYSCHVAK